MRSSLSPILSVVLFAICGTVSLSQEISTSRVERTAPGPWGSLELYEVPLECPSEYLRLVTMPSQRVEWRFRARTQSQLESILMEIGCTIEEVATLLKGATVMSDPEILRVFPQDQTVLEMPSAIRSKLYAKLATIPENYYFQHPIYINSENLSQWFDGTEVPRSAIEDISKLAYPTPSRRGFYFADLPFTLRRAQSAREEKLLLGSLIRPRGLIVRLHLTRESLTPEIAAYWTAGYKNKAVMPFFESVMAANDEDGTVDIAHLLPATPRQYLNRFPDTSDGVRGRYPDWFWTCYNFFRFAPVEVYADSAEREALIISEFEATLPPLQFGDMLLLNSGAKTIHGCVYIADDIVFTKNGGDLFSPWVLMKLNDVVAHHNLFGDVSLSAYRKTQADAPPTP